MAAAREEARLLLPSPLGLLEYDLLEGATFVGPAARGGLEAAPTPFPKAAVVIAREGDEHVARALPGAEGVLVNGAPADGTPLGDGAELGIGGEKAYFRGPSGPAAPPPPSRPPSREAVRPPPPRARALPLWPLALLAAGIVLYAVTRAVDHLQAARRADSVLAREFPEPRAGGPTEISEETRSLLELDARARTHASDIASITAELDRLRGAIQRSREPDVVAALRARWNELHERLAREEHARIGAAVDDAVAAGQFARAFDIIARHEHRFAGVIDASEATPLRERIAREAAVSLDVFLRDVAPLVVHAPRDAYVRLVEALDRFPASFAPTLEPLIASARRHLYEKVPDTAPRAPDSRRPPPDAPPSPAASPGASEGRDPGPPPDASDPDAIARKAWRTAHADLLAARYADAAKAYRGLLDLHGEATLPRLHRPALEAAERWARAGRDGPHVILHGDAKFERGKLEVRYEFDQRAQFAEDFTVEQPFATDQPIEAAWKEGSVTMRLGTGLFHRLVFADDVRVEAAVHAEVARDFGILAVEEGSRYRALLFHLNNTRFKLKKGDAARPQSGHLLWLVGEGVWAAADADQHGFVKFAESPESSLRNGDRLRLEFERSGRLTRGVMQGESDRVRLEGQAVGDDGSGVASARVGLFTDGGHLNVDSVRIVGQVDMAWWARHLVEQVALLATPP